MFYYATTWYDFDMPYYAVGYGDNSGFFYRPATAEEIAKWELDNPGQTAPTDLSIRTGHFSASDSKVAGPFKNAKIAWKVAADLQRGASMRQPWPMVVKMGSKVTLKLFQHKLDYDEIRFNEEYCGKNAIHKGHFINQDLRYKRQRRKKSV